MRGDFTKWSAQDSLALIDRALVVGLGLMGPADEQGTPVQIRDGPAAVTENFPRNYLAGHCQDLIPLELGPDGEKARFAVGSEVRRPTSALVMWHAARDGRHTALVLMRW